MSKFYITTPIYYVNDKPHIGHTYTTVAADVLARYHRQKNDEVFFLTGTDEHGSKIARSAQKAGLSEQKFADKQTKLYQKYWSELLISNDAFVRTTDPIHEKIAGEFFTQLKKAKTPKDNLALYEKNYEGLYCVGCEAYKKESDLEDGKCPDHKIEPEKVSEKNWFFKLSDFEDVLKKKIGLDEIKIMPEGRKNEVLGFLASGLEDIAATRSKVDWGIRVPFDETQTIYVWMEALINYISALGWPDGEKFEQFWPADLHLMAKDILKFHAIIWPAMLIALEMPLPKVVFAHGYFTINGEKMSKTVGNVISPADLINKFGAESTRYLLLSQFPLGSDGDISMEKLKEKYESDLSNGIGNLISRVLNLVEKNFDGKIPHPVKSPKDLSVIGAMLEEGKTYEALVKIQSVVTWANQYIDKKKVWELVKTKKDEAGVILGGLVELIIDLGNALMPFMPETSQKIIKLATAEKIVKGEGLFPRIE